MGIGTKVSGTNFQDRGPADKLHDPGYRGDAQLDLEKFDYAIILHASNYLNIKIIINEESDKERWKRIAIRQHQTVKAGTGRAFSLLV